MATRVIDRTEKGLLNPGVQVCVSGVVKFSRITRFMNEAELENASRNLDEPMKGNRVTITIENPQIVKTVDVDPRDPLVDWSSPRWNRPLRNGIFPGQQVNGQNSIFGFVGNEFTINQLSVIEDFYVARAGTDDPAPAFSLVCPAPSLPLLFHMPQGPGSPAEQIVAPEGELAQNQLVTLVLNCFVYGKKKDKCSFGLAAVIVNGQIEYYRPAGALTADSLARFGIPFKGSIQQTQPVASSESHDSDGDGGAVLPQGGDRGGFSTPPVTTQPQQQQQQQGQGQFAQQGQQQGQFAQQGQQQQGQFGQQPQQQAQGQFNQQAQGQFGQQPQQQAQGQFNQQSQQQGQFNQQPQQQQGQFGQQPQQGQQQVTPGVNLNNSPFNVSSDQPPF